MKKAILLLFFFSNYLFAQQPKLMLPIGHTNNVHSAQFSPDGKKIVTASQDKTAKIWDALTGNLLADLKGHTGGVNSAQFSPDGKKIVTSSWDNNAKIWDAVTGNLIIDLKGHTGGVLSAQFSPDGKKIATTSQDKTAKIWNALTGNLLYDLKGHTDDVTSAQFSPDGKKIVTTGWEDHAKLWDAVNGILIADFLKEHIDVNLLNTKFSPDGAKIVTTSLREAIIWDAQTGKPITYLNGFAGSSGCVQFSPDGSKIVTASYKGIQIWKTDTGKHIVDFKGNKSSVNSLFFSPDGKKIVTAYRDGSVTICDVVTGNQLAELKGHTKSVNSAYFSSNGKKIVTSSEDCTAKIWSADTGKLMFDLKGNNTDVKLAEFSPDSKRIVVLATDSSPKIWDVLNCKIIADLKGHKAEVNSAQFSPDGKKIVTACDNDRTSKVWDAFTGNLLTDLNGHLGGVTFAQFSPNGRNIVTASCDKVAKIWDVVTGSLVTNFKGHTDCIESVQFSQDGKKIVTASWDKTAKLWDVYTGKLLANLLGHTNRVNSAQFSPDAKKIITATNDGIAKLWAVDTGNLIANLNGFVSQFHAEQFSPDSQKIVIPSENSNGAKIWDINTNNMITYLKGNTLVNNSIFSPDGKKALIEFIDGTAKIWDSNTGIFITDLKGRTDSAYSTHYSHDGKKIVSIIGWSGAIEIWNAETGKIIYTLFLQENGNYLVQIPSGYYRCTPDAAKLLHYVTKDLKVITFEQLDVKYNRPDKVLEAIGSSDIELINSYKKAYEKRIKKLEINTSSFDDGYSVPEADFVDRETIEYEQKNEILTLHIKGLDNTYKLDRFNVWVNEVPIFGLKGKSIRDKNLNTLDTSVTISLSQGENRIETSITNVNATESYRMPLNVNYTPVTAYKEKTYFIGIGIDQFQNNKYNLKYSTKDIHDLVIKLKETIGDNLVIDTLFNRNVTVANVKVLKQLLQKTNINDKVIISYSGHGVLSKNYDYYLSTYGIDFEKPENNGLAYDELENLLDNIPARKKLMLIDACHSGEVDKEEMEKIKNTSDNAVASSGAKGIIPIFIPDSKKIGMKSSFELMQQLFVNVGKSTGATIISAAGGTQFALEDGGLKNGVFTYSILEYMKNNPDGTLSKLKEYVNKRVPELTKGMQVPTARTETNAIDWKVW